MNNTIFGRRIRFALVAVFLMSLSTWAMADPPFRIARLGYFSGAVSFSPAGTDDWVLASVNRPLVTGDRLWADTGARAELRAASAMVRLGAGTSVTLLNIDDRVTQLQLAQGSVSFNVWRLAPGEVFEVDTPNLAFTVMAPGAYRLDVDADGNSTNVVVRSGQGEVTGEGAAYLVDPQVSYVFAGYGLGDYQSMAPPPPDEFDAWASERDRRRMASPSARYVSPELVGYEDLDNNGTWRTDPAYGSVWVPEHVAAGWSPYHDGHWAWVDPYGWTWVDDAPWGFAVSHYGRWAYVGNSWGWVPGPIAAAPVYAPALVAFVGGSDFSVSLSLGGGGIAWFPLGPRDVYRPSYAVSQNYFIGINNSNTSINNTTITNIYSTKNVTNITYANQAVPDAVIAVPAAAFTGSKPIAAAAVRVPAAAMAKAQVTSVAAVAPTPASVSGAGARSTKPPAAVLARQAVAKTPPPAPPVPFAAKQAALTANPGKPLDAQQTAAIKPSQAAAPAVKVVKAAPPKAPPTPRTQPLAPAAAQAKGGAVPNAPKAAESPNAAPNAAAKATAPKPPEAKQQAPANVPKPPEPKPALAPKEEKQPEAKPAATPANVPRPPEARPIAPKPPEAKPQEAKPVSEPARPAVAPPKPKETERERPAEPQRAAPAPREAPKPVEKKEPAAEPARKEAPPPKPKEAEPQKPAQPERATQPKEAPKPAEKKEEKKEEKRE